MAETQPWIGAVIDGDDIVIRVQVAMLPSMLAVSHDGLGAHFRVTNLDGFAADVRRALNTGNDEGVTPLHVLIDRAIVAAIESDSSHVDEITVCNV